MSHLQTSNDILQDALFRAGEGTATSGDYYAKALTWLNRAYRALAMGGSEFDPTINETWWWLKKEATIILQPTFKAGSVSLTNNSASAAFASSVSASKAGFFLKADGHADVFKISTHATGTASMTLDSVYTGDTASAASYRSFLVEYSLASDCIKVIAPMRGYQDARHKIDGIPLRKLEDDYPLGEIGAGTPDVFAMVNETTVRFNRYGSDTGNLIRLDYDYIYRPADLTATNTPVVPLQYRYILSDMTTFYLMTEKDDTRAEGIGLQARSGIRAMARENAMRWAQIGEPGQIWPRQAETLANRGPLRTESGLIIG